MFTGFLVCLGYDLFVSPREKEETYETGLIAFKKDVFILEHLQQIDYTKFFGQVKEKAQAIGCNNLNYKY